MTGGNAQGSIRIGVGGNISTPNATKAAGTAGLVTPRHKGKLMTIIPENPETLLDRRETAAALTAKGFPITRGTLSYSPRARAPKNEGRPIVNSGAGRFTAGPTPWPGLRVGCASRAAAPGTWWTCSNRPPEKEKSRRGAPNTGRLLAKSPGGGRRGETWKTNVRVLPCHAALGNPERMPTCIFTIRRPSTAPP